MANLKINSQSYKAGDVIMMDDDFYIVTDSTVADLDTVLPEIIPTQKVNVEINIIDWT